jgi:hypothetical protein
MLLSIVPADLGKHIIEQHQGWQEDGDERPFDYSSSQFLS